MAKDLNWQTDPVVLLEKEILPVLGAAPEWLARVLIGSGSASDDLPASFRRARKALDAGGADFLGPVGMRLDRSDHGICRAAETAVGKVETALRSLQNESGDTATQAAADIADAIATDMRPKVNAALDVFRRVFIGTVLERQTAQAQQAETAVKQLTEISETIFFIAVNASVEAARAGDAGRGFAVIGQDIRNLSLNARAATEGLCAIMDGR